MEYKQINNESIFVKRKKKRVNFIANAKKALLPKN